MRGVPIKPGQKYGRLTVQDKKKRNDHGNVKWLCLCECGKKKYYYAWQLRSGDTLSCGCYKKENIKMINSLTPRRGKVTGKEIADQIHSQLWDNADLEEKKRQMVICPHCFREVEKWAYDELPEPNSMEVISIYCPSCDQPFELRVELYYNTTKKGEYTND